MYENVLMPVHAAFVLGTTEALVHTRTLDHDPRPGEVDPRLQWSRHR